MTKKNSLIAVLLFGMMLSSNPTQAASLIDYVRSFFSSSSKVSVPSWPSMPSISASLSDIQRNIAQLAPSLTYEQKVSFAVSVLGIIGLGFLYNKYGKSETDVPVAASYGNPAEQEYLKNGNIEIFLNKIETSELYGPIVSKQIKILKMAQYCDKKEATKMPYSRFNMLKKALVNMQDPHWKMQGEAQIVAFQKTVNDRINRIYEGLIQGFKEKRYCFEDTEITLEELEQLQKPELQIKLPAKYLAKASQKPHQSHLVFIINNSGNLIEYRIPETDTCDLPTEDTKILQWKKPSTYGYTKLNQYGIDKNDETINFFGSIKLNDDETDVIMTDKNNRLINGLCIRSLDEYSKFNKTTNLNNQLVTWKKIIYTRLKNPNISSSQRFSLVITLTDQWHISDR